jgi:hypothetical protein
VDQHRSNFLAGAALTQDQDWNIRTRNKRAMSLNFPHPLAASDK